jgi:hypothetical protein
VGLGKYVQVFRGIFVKLGITGKESSAFGGFAFPFVEGKRGGVLNGSKQRLRTVRIPSIIWGTTIRILIIFGVPPHDPHLEIIN